MLTLSTLWYWEDVLNPDLWTSFLPLVSLLVGKVHCEPPVVLGVNVAFVSLSAAVSTFCWHGLELFTQVVRDACYPRMRQMQLKLCLRVLEILEIYCAINFLFAQQTWRLALFRPAVEVLTL